MKRVIAILSLIIIAGIASTPILFDQLDSSLDPPSSTDSKVGEAMMNELTGSDGTILVLLDEATSEQISRYEQTLSTWTHIVDVDSLEQAPTGKATSTLLMVSVSIDADGDEREQLLEDVTALVVDGSNAAPRISGSLAIDEELGDTAESDLARADILTIPVVIVLLGIVLGSMRMSLIGLLVTLGVVSGSLLILLAIAQLTTVSVFAVNVVTLFGVGLAVDYTLVLVSRFREEVNQHDTVSAALEVTMGTAGKAVLYSGLTTAASLSALLVFRETTLRSLAYGAIAATAVALILSRWLLPALLMHWGAHVTPLSSASKVSGITKRLVQVVQRRPGLATISSIALLVVMALPLQTVNFEGLDVRALPESSVNRQLAEELPQNFPDVWVQPITILAKTSSVEQRAAYIQEIEKVDNVEATQLFPAGDKVIITVKYQGSVADNKAMEVVRSIRGIEPGFETFVSGEAAEEVDLLSSISDRLWVSVVVLISLMFLLLTFLLRSPVAALKAILINALSIAASFGLLVLIFQHGYLSRIFGFEPTGGLQVVVLLLTFAFAFGLSMDYEVVLLSRMKEEYQRDGNNLRAVEIGMRSTARIIAIAASLMVVVFVGFASGDLALIKQLGIGLALAVLVDATLVRLVLVPAAMTVMGDLNWWPNKRQKDHQ